MKPDAPERYVVVRGDTLWSIAQRYTDSPWRWPELWEQNKDEIKNPNRIYPGNVIVLDRARGRLALSDTVRLSPKVHAESTAQAAIPAIPPSIIEPFLTRPVVIEADGLDNAPTLGIHAYMVDLGYAVNTNLQISGGWQQLHYARSIGSFYNGAPRIAMDAVFVHAVINI